MTAKQVEFLTIINRVSQCTANRSNSKTNLPHNELLIQPLLLQASYWVLWLPVPQYKNTIIPLRVDACNETAQLLPLAGGDLNSQQALKSSQHGHRQQKSKHYLSGLCTKSCPAKRLTVSFRVPEALRWLEGHFLSAGLLAAAAGLARTVWNT